jgi:hypothetical protein
VANDFFNNQKNNLMKRWQLALTFAFALFVAASAQGQDRHLDYDDGSNAFTVGKTVLANWSYDDYWYAAKIEAVSNDKFWVRYLDGEGEWLTTTELSFFSLNVGDKIFAKPEGDLVYKSAEVGKREGDKVFVKYAETGETGWTTLANIRIK